MGKIIVGIDFSNGSIYATNLAVDIANRWNCDIRLVYVVKEKGSSELSGESLSHQIELIIKDQNFVERLGENKIDYVVRQGKVSQELSSQAIEDEAELVIVGSHGTSGYESNWIGRNTYRTITESPVPVLNVREDFNFNKALENIVVPIDSTPDTRQKVPIAMKFAKAFGSKIHILGLYTSDIKDIRNMVQNYVASVETQLEKKGVKFESHFIEAQKNLTVSTLDYASKVNADIIVIMTEQEKAFNNLFLGSFAQQMIHVSKVPIVTIRPEQINSSAK